MAYIKGNDVLPETLLAEVQQYIDGAYLYIPRREEWRKPWGGQRAPGKRLPAATV